MSIRDGLPGRAHRWWLATLLALPLVTASPVLAVDAPTVEPSGTLTLVGRLADGEASGSLRLVANDPTDVILTSGALERKAPDGSSGSSADRLEPSAVTIDPRTFSLVPGRPADVKITVKGFRYAGTYAGTIKLEFAATPVAPPSGATAPPIEFGSVDLKLNVEVSGAPKFDLASGSSPVAIAKTTCGAGFPLWDPIECALARILVAPVELENDSRLAFRNSGQGQAQVLNPSVSLKNRSTGKDSPDGAVTVIAPGPVEPQMTADMTVRVDRSKLDPGSYDGFVSYNIAGVPEQSSLNLTLTARRGPGIPLVLILSGVGVVWVATKALRWKASRDAVTASIDLATKGSLALDELERGMVSADIDLVRARIDALRNKAAQGWSDADITAAAALKTDLESLRVARWVDNQIVSQPGFEEARALTNTTRAQIGLGDSASASSAADEAVIAFEEEAVRRQMDYRSDLRRRDVTFLIPDTQQAPTLARRALRSLNLRIELPPAVLAKAATWLARGVRWGAFAIFVFIGLKLAYTDTLTFTGASLSDLVLLVGYGTGTNVVSKYLGALTARS